MRVSWVCKMVDGVFTLIPAHEYVPESNSKWSHGVLEDTIPETWHPVTGKGCSSRTGMIKQAKMHGCEEWSPGIKRSEPKRDRTEVIERIKHFDRELRRDHRGTMERFNNRMRDG